jgi:hypothetical protein
MSTIPMGNAQLFMKELPKKGLRTTNEPERVD